MNSKKFFSFDWLSNPFRKKIIKQEKLIKENNKDIIKTLYYSKNYITIVLYNDKVLMGKCTDEKYELIKNAISEEEIINIFNNFEEDLIKNSDLAILKVNDDFTVTGNTVYLEPSVISLPEIVKASFIELLEKRLALTSSFADESFDDKINELDKDYKSLKMFWYKLSLSPLEKCRESVLTFCKNNDIRLSPTGNLITYRNIVNYKQESIFENLAKTIKRKDFDKHYVLESGFDNSCILVKKYANLRYYPGFSKLGLLSDLLKNKDYIDTIYTSQHNKGKYTFKIGDIYKLAEDDQPNDQLQNCHESGIHCASVDYNYNYYGDTKVVCLVDPSKIIYTPENDTGKFRCSELKIALLNPNNSNTHINETLIEKADLEYNEYTIDNLQKAIITKSIKDLSVRENTPVINISNIKDIYNALSNKVINI